MNEELLLYFMVTLIFTHPTYFSGREPPQLELYPEESQSIQSGGSALFQCRVIGGAPSPTMTWSRYDIQSQAKKRLLVS